MFEAQVVIAVALLLSAIGFKKYIWFISIGYGFAIAGIGLVLTLMYFPWMDTGMYVVCGLLMAYGCRLGGYLTFREFKMHSYNKKMEGEIKDGAEMSMISKVGIWAGAAILYFCQTAPVLYRLDNEIATDDWVIAGIVLMAIGFLLETAADVQKSVAKRKNPGRFVSTGLYRIVRCPNYLGELIFWTGVFLVGVTSNQGMLQWLICICGFVGIIYVMFSGARRLEMRQNRTYGKNKAYRAYVSSVPILIPLIPLYSVEKYKWLVA